jgi:hypothetical protein
LRRLTRLREGDPVYQAGERVHRSRFVNPRRRVPFPRTRLTVLSMNATTFPSIFRNDTEVLLNLTTAAKIIGVSTPTLKLWILKGEVRGIPSPFAELAAPSTRRYTTPQRLREWFRLVSEQRAA